MISNHKINKQISYQIKLMNFKQQIITKLKNITKLKEIPLEVPPDPLMGDYAFPCFILCRKLKKSPAEIAKELVDRFKTGKFIEKVTANGPYLNFFINKEYFIQEALNNSFEIKPYKKIKKRIMVEYCAPNTNKPLHLGHLRNMFIGNSVSLLLKFTGCDIIQANLVNDRGIHICQSMLAYKKYGNNKKPNKKTDHFVGDFYVMFQNKKNEELEKESYELLKKYEKGDKETLSLWKKMNDWALKGFEETYTKLNIKFDKVYYESEYYKKAKELILKYYKKGIFRKDNDGNIIAPTEPYRVVLRDDGTSVYITQDIYLAHQKFRDYKLDKSIYVVASEQNLHFKQLFEILKLMKYKWHDKLYHLSYGLVNLPEGRMKSREGKVVDADDIIEEMTSLAEKEIKKRHKLSEKELKERSKAIGIAALKFYMLKNDPAKEIVYNPEESISFEGETGPYLQYTYARICSILRKYGKKVKKANTTSLKNREDFEIAKLLAEFNNVVEESTQNYKPSLLCRYLLDLSQKFNNYYRYYPIMREKEEELREARLMLAYCVKEILKTGLSLLGKEAIEEM